MDLSNDIQRLFPDLGKIDSGGMDLTTGNGGNGQQQVKVTVAPVNNPIDKPSDDDFLEDEKLIPEVKQPIEQEKKTEPEIKTDQVSDSDKLKWFYDFNAQGVLNCKFLGVGPEVTFPQGKVKTWKVVQLSTPLMEWLLPQWEAFSQEQGSFIGFHKETPEKFIYQITWKGIKDLGNNKRAFLLEILKKLNDPL